jgi:hypothetical protein
MNMWNNYFSELLKVHMVSDIGQMEIHKTELSVNEPSPCVFEISPVELKSLNSKY